MKQKYEHRINDTDEELHEDTLHLNQQTTEEHRYTRFQEADVVIGELPKIRYRRNPYVTHWLTMKHVKDSNLLTVAQLSNSFKINTLPGAHAP